MNYPALARRTFLTTAMLFSFAANAVLAQDQRWRVLTPDHPLWSPGLEGAAVQMPDGSFAMLLLRPSADGALASVAFPGTPGQTELLSTLQMGNGGAPRLKIEGENLLPLPAPDNGFAAYGFVIASEDFALLQAGSAWTLTTPTDEITFPLTGSRIAIAKVLELREEKLVKTTETASD